MVFFYLKPKGFVLERCKQYYYIAADINEYVKSCEQCQKQGDLTSTNLELKSIPVPSSVMKQVGVGISNLPEVDRHRYVIVLIHYFSK